MVRFITCLTLLFAFVTLVSAQVTVINTPTGDITEGVTIPITWDTNGPATAPGTLRAINKSTQNNTVISDTIDLNAKTFSWIVEVAPGTYNLALNDGTGDKFSGAFNVVAPKSPGAAPPASPKDPAPPTGPPAKEPPTKGPPPPKVPPPPKGPPPAKTKIQMVQRAPPSASVSLAYPASPSAQTHSAASTISIQNLWLSLMGVSLLMIHFA